MLAGTQIQLEGWLEAVATFDVDQLAGKSVGIFPLSNSTVEDVFSELEHILSSASDDGQIAGHCKLSQGMSWSDSTASWWFLQELTTLSLFDDGSRNLIVCRTQPLSRRCKFIPFATVTLVSWRVCSAPFMAAAAGASSGTRGGVAPGMAQATAGVARGYRALCPRGVA